MNEERNFAGKTEYLTELRRRLAALPEEEREAALTYYEEYFDDAGPDDFERVLAELGTVQALAEQILSGYSRDYLDITPKSSSTQIPARPEDAAKARYAEERLEQERMEQERLEQERRERERREQQGAAAEPRPAAQPRRRSGGSVILLTLLVILALPLLIPLVITVFALAFALVAVALAAAAAVGAVVLGLLVGGVVLFVVGIGLFITNTLEALIACGFGLVLLGVGLVLLLLCLFLFVKVAPAVIRLLVQIIRWPFNRKAVRA